MIGAASARKVWNKVRLILFLGRSNVKKLCIFY
jgi:hypothetical protein